MTTIEITLCKEDRDRLDKALDALNTVGILLANAGNPINTINTLTHIDKPAEGLEVEGVELEGVDFDPVELTEPEPPQAEPSVDLAQIQQKVVQLCAIGGGVKKAAVRGIINEYGAKVSDLKDKPEKWDEVWSKLCNLEQEG